MRLSRIVSPEREQVEIFQRNLNPSSSNSSPSSSIPSSGRYPSSSIIFCKNINHQDFLITVLDVSRYFSSVFINAFSPILFLNRHFLGIFFILTGKLTGHVSCLKNIGPDRLGRFDVYWIQRDRVYRQAYYLQKHICLITS